MPVVAEAAALRALIQDCFERLAIPREDAAAVADVLVYADLRGIDSHGIDRLPAYMRRVKAGAAGGTARMSVVAESGPLRRLDGGHALGPAAAVKATDAAIALAKQHGVGVVAVGNSGHFGAAGFYALRAAKAGLLAIVATNGPKVMAPHGAAEPFLGANPIAFGAPLGDADELVLDMSSTVVAKGKIRRAKTFGNQLDSGWALDADGSPTTDAAKALSGSVLPVGGPKGSGLALAINVIVALLAGADFDHEAASIYGDPAVAQNVGHLFLVIDPWRITDRDVADERLGGLIDALHGLRPQPGFDDVRYPGEAAARRVRARLGSGITLEAADLDAVSEACLECGLPDLADRARALAAGDDPARP